MIEFIGTQPVILRGAVTGIRYTFVPGTTGLVDKQDVEKLVQTGLIKVGT